MNVAVDRLVRRVLGDPGLLENFRDDPSAVAGESGVSAETVRAVASGDLVTLHEHGLHPLLVMQLAQVLKVDPMERLGYSDRPE